MSNLIADYFLPPPAVAPGKNPLFEALRPASFRGVPFEIEGTELEGGRRKQLHEYPERDEPYVKDLGRSARKIEFDAFVVGQDYQAKMEALLGALEAAGAGTLVHPWFGSLTVDAVTFRLRQDRSVGYAKFSLAFIESGALAFPSAVSSTAAASRTAAGNLESASVNRFAKLFAALNYVNYVAQRALTLYGTVLTFLANPVYAVSSALGFGGLAGNLGSLAAAFSTPLDLGWSMSGLLNISFLAKSGALTSSASTAAAKDAILIPLAATLVTMAQSTTLAAPVAVVSGSATVMQIGKNEAAIKANIRQLLLVQAVGLTSYFNCAVYDDVMALMAKLLAALDAEALLTVDDAVYDALIAARSAVFADLSSRASNSARLVTIVPPTVLPALVIAYDYYQDAGRADEIVARNKVANPGFLPPVGLRVLSQ